jgi:diacylglycerol kinase (CTP)
MNRTLVNVFPPVWFLQKHSNGVIWYIIGVVFVLSLYPLDIAVLSIMMWVVIYSTVAVLVLTWFYPNSLSWADTAASTFGRLWGSRTPPLPPRIPILGLPLAPRKSLAGFLAASITGAAIVFSFWSWFVPTVGGAHPAWDLTHGVSGPGVDQSTFGQGMKATLRDAGFSGLPTGGWMGLAVISVVSGLVSGVAEALGASFSFLSCACTVDDIYHG